MLKLNDISKDARFNGSFSHHDIFKDGNVEIKKVFPEIGLANFSESIVIDNSKEIKLAAIDLLHAAYRELDRRYSSITRYAETKSTKDKTTPFGKKRTVKYAKCSFILKNIRDLLEFKESFISFNSGSGKTTLNLPQDIFDDEENLVFKKGEGFFRVYQKINVFLENGLFIPMLSLDSFQEFKKFSNVNVPKNESKVVFSSSGIDGAWDIATMSMRGIKSCQSWDSTNSTSLVGSVVDPFTAIMYLTTGSMSDSKMGSKMIRRSIIRFVIDKEDNKPALLMERMFPEANSEIASIFLKILKAKTDNKMKIIDCSKNIRRIETKTLFIPLVPITERLQPHYLPYRDSAIPFQKVCHTIVTYKKELSVSIDRRLSGIINRFHAITSSLKLKEATSPKDRAYWRENISLSSSHPITYVLPTKLISGCVKIKNKYTESITDFSQSTGVTELRVLDVILTDANLEPIIDDMIVFMCSGKLKPSKTYQKIIRKRIKEVILQSFDKEKLMILNYIKRNPKVNQAVNLDQESLELIEKVS